MFIYLFVKELDFHDCCFQAAGYNNLNNIFSSNWCKHADIDLIIPATLDRIFAINVLSQDSDIAVTNLIASSAYINITTTNGDVDITVSIST